MRCFAMFVAVMLLVCLAGGCSATYVPISWGMGERVQRLSRSDRTLAILFERYDPKRQTLRVAGESFDEVMMPSEVQHHLGVYRPDTKLIYRNMYNEYSDKQLRDLMVHELAHHIWFGSMSKEQREEWIEHLNGNPSHVREMVRRLYHKTTDHDTEDFAFSVEYARPEDMDQLAYMELITQEERDVIVAERARFQTPSTTELQAGTAELRDMAELQGTPDRKTGARDLQVSTRVSAAAPESTQTTQ